jgi:hypothetical protein
MLTEERLQFPLARFVNFVSIAQGPKHVKKFATFSLVSNKTSLDDGDFFSTFPTFSRNFSDFPTFRTLVSLPRAPLRSPPKFVYLRVRNVLMHHSTEHSHVFPFSMTCFFRLGYVLGNVSRTSQISSEKCIDLTVNFWQ